jgi:ribose transport system ATP-binding protein
MKEHDPSGLRPPPHLNGEGSPSPFLELVAVGKTYPGVRALDDVSLSVARGEVVALIGENGAGKSTLMKVLGGVVAPSEGAIRIDGVEHRALSVARSMEAGIAFVHQELNLFDNLDVAANVMIGREPVRGGPLRLIDRAAMRARVTPLLERLGVDFTADTLVADLSLAQRQLVEITKALSLDARLVIMDEPTSSLTSSETARLLKVIAELKAAGVSVIFISHRLNEVEQCADRVVVLRDGAVVGALSKGEITHDAMIRLMIGRDLRSLYIPPQRPAGAPVLEVTGLRTSAHAGEEIDLALRGGEILGMAGLVGAGRTELACAIFGVDRRVAGTMRLDGTGIDVAAPRDAIDRGIFLVPEDRKRSGLVLEQSVTENISLANLKAFASGLLVRSSAERRNATEQRTAMNIKAASIDTIVGTLSGGNQQKVVLAKWLSMKPRVVIFDEPTRGIDVGSKSEIYRLMRGLADAGVAVLMISSDMEEVIGVSDRIAVMREGRISGYLERAMFSEESVMRLAVGRQDLKRAHMQVAASS